MTVFEYDGPDRRRRRRRCASRRRRCSASTSCCPDFSYLRDRVDDIEAIVVTHGHEDHLGALPWVLRELGAADAPPVYGAPADDGDGALQARGAQAARGRADRPRADGEPVDARAVLVELIHMTHSIPDASAVALTRELGTVLVTGDYKFDQTPVDGEAADMARLAQLGARGRSCFCAGTRPTPTAPASRPRSRSSDRTSRRSSRARRARDRDELRLQHPPRPAGHRRRRGARPQGRARRALDAQERRDRRHSSATSRCPTG